MGNVIYLADYAKQAPVGVVEPVSVAAQILSKYPNLIEGNGCVVAAKNMRIELKAAFPGVKFSVQSEKYSGGNSINIRYEDGPIASDVEAIVNKYAYGNFDGMDDSYKYDDNAFNDIFGGTYYVFVNRDYSQGSVEAAIDIVVSEYGQENKIDYAGFQNGDGFNKYPAGYSNYDYNWQQLVRLQLQKMDFYSKKEQLSA